MVNDDGVYAEGLMNLYEALVPYAEVTVVAPLEERSATGHGITLVAPIRLKKINDNSNIYGCSGYPVDCVFMGLDYILKDDMPDLVISGINRGANLGLDIYYSGTVAGAREAALRGIPSVAISVDLLESKNRAHYDPAIKFMEDFVKKSMHKSIAQYSFLNINLPNIPHDQIQSVETTSVGRRKYSGKISQKVGDSGVTEYFIGGNYEGFESIKGSDCNAVNENRISISAIDVTPLVNSFSYNNNFLGLGD